MISRLQLTLSVLTLVNVFYRPQRPDRAVEHTHTHTHTHTHFEVELCLNELL